MNAYSYYNAITGSNSNTVQPKTNVNNKSDNEIQSRVKSDNKYHQKNGEKNLYMNNNDPASITKTNELMQEMDNIIRERYNLK